MKAIFERAFPYGDDLLALPVPDLDAAASWYAQHFAMVFFVVAPDGLCYYFHWPIDG